MLTFANQKTGISFHMQVLVHKLQYWNLIVSGYFGLEKEGWTYWKPESDYHANFWGVFPRGWPLFWFTFHELLSSSSSSSTGQIVSLVSKKKVKNLAVVIHSLQGVNTTIRLKIWLINKLSKIQGKIKTLWIFFAPLRLHLRLDIPAPQMIYICVFNDSLNSNITPHAVNTASSWCSSRGSFL